MATIRILVPGDEPALETFLLPRIDSSMFLLGNLRSAGLVDNGEFLQGTYAAAFEGDRIVGVVAHYWGGNLLLQAPHHLAALWRAAVGASGRAVAGIVGPADQVFSIRDEVAAIGAEFRMNSLENLYSLALNSLRTPAILASASIRGRRARADDAERLTRWRVAYSMEALDEHETDALWARCRRHSERALQERTAWVLEAGGEVAAMSGFNTVTGDAVQVGGVYTPRALRGRGYARAVVAQSLLDARAEGATLGILFTDDGNVAAHRAYTALGFEIVGEYAIVLLRDPVTIPDQG